MSEIRKTDQPTPKVVFKVYDSASIKFKMSEKDDSKSKFRVKTS